ncbi:MAG: carboxypeptidase regulatory-like domain-containing protein, partial [Vicinamibacteraceae bacterium]
MTLLRSTAMILLAVAIAVPVFAQDTRGRVQGSVVDETEGTLPGVSLTLQNDATGVAVTRVSGSNGRYVFDQVDPGLYTLTAALEGFASLVQKNVRVPQRGDVTVDMVLRVSDVAETVTVEASPVAVQFNTSHRDLTIEQSFIKEMPIATRNAATLAILDPSVNGDFDRSSNVDHYAGNAYDIGGQTKGQNDILIDGSPLANSAKLGYNPPIDTVAEYTVIQNAVDAEYGHSAGGIVTMAMKSGTNEIHGSGYYFGGDPDWNAVTDRITRSRSPNTFWNGGATLGMPLIRNKLFLFSAFERQNDESFGALGYTVPTARERMGDFSQSVNADGSPRIIYDPMTSRVEDGRIVRDPFPGNAIPSDRRDPLAQRILDNLWDPNNPGDDLTGLNNYRYDNSATFRYWNFSNRVDWQVNDRWKTFARYSFFMTDQDANDYLNGADTLKMRRTEGSQRDGFNFAADANYTVSSTTMLSVSGSYYKTVDRRNFPEMNVGDEGYRDLWPSEWWSPYMPGRPLVYFPNIQVAPTDDTFGVRNFWWQQPWGSSVGAKLIKHVGNHAVKVGANVRWKRGDAARFFFTNLMFTGELTRETASGGNRLTGHPWADFLLGAMDPENALRGLPTSTQFIPLQEANTEMYALYL